MAGEVAHPGASGNAKFATPVAPEVDPSTLAIGWYADVACNDYIEDSEDVLVCVVKGQSEA